MGSRGPLPDPRSSESRRGRNTLHRRAGKTASADTVTAPAFIVGNSTAMSFWSKHAPALVAARRLTPLQADTLAVICEQFAEVRLLTDMVNAEGLTIDTPRGRQANPALRALRDARRDLLAAARGFGLDAASDARLPAEPPPQQLSVIDKFRAMKQARVEVSPDDADLTPAQRQMLRHGTAAERAAVTADVLADRRMFQ
jgi:P27 family predicted phage terminase small subunit